MARFRRAPKDEHRVSNFRFGTFQITIVGVSYARCLLAAKFESERSGQTPFPTIPTHLLTSITYFNLEPFPTTQLRRYYPRLYEAFDEYQSRVHGTIFERLEANRCE